MYALRRLALRDAARTLAAIGLHGGGGNGGGGDGGGGGGGGTATVAVNLTVAGPLLPNGGDDDIDRGTRLHWFDSRLGIGGDAVPSPYTAIAVQEGKGGGGGATVTMLGKAVAINGHGLPSSVQVDAWANHPTLAKQREALGGAITFGVGGLELGPPTLSVGARSNMSVAWGSTATDTAGAATVAVAGTLDCTGYALFNITVTALAAVAEAGVRLVVPTNPASSFFAMGLGQAGGLMDEWLNRLPAARAPTQRRGSGTAAMGTTPSGWGRRKPGCGSS